MTVLSEEGTNVDLVASSTVVSVDRSEGSVWGVVVLDFEFSLKRLESSLEVDFLFDNLSESKFDVSWELVVSSNMSGWSVEGSVSKVVIFAWENNLEELLEGESLVSVAIEEKDEGVEFTFTNVVDLVVSKEVGELSAGDLERVVSINSLESRVWGKVWDGTESSSCVFEFSFSIANCDEEVLKSSFRFVTEHCVVVCFLRKI